MLPPFLGASLVVALLSGTAKATDLSQTSRCVATARFDLLAESSEGTPDVCVSADEPTTFFFDSRVAVGAVELQPAGRLADWAVGQERVSLLVIPKADYLPGERIRVTVRFADGTIPASASFWLVGHAARGTRRVEVYRQPRPPEVLKKERDEAQAEVRHCQEDKARLLAERESPGGLMGTAWLEEAGSVASKEIRLEREGPLGNAVLTLRGWSYSYTREGESRPAGVAVRLKLKNPGTEPWMLAGAALVDSTGEEVALATWQKAPIASGATNGVVVGTETVPEHLGCPCTLKLWEAGGPRVVTVDAVDFPTGIPARE